MKFSGMMYPKNPRPLRMAFGLFSLWALTLSPQTEAALLKEARVTRIVNDVDLIDATQSRRDARTNDVMRDDMVLATGHKSRAELKFTDETLARIGANSFFTFSEGTRNMELGKGTMLLKVPKGAGGAKISTQSVTAAITGTTVLLETNPGGEVVLNSDTTLPPTPEADEDLRRQGLGAYVGQGLSSVPPVRQVSATRPASGRIRVAEVNGPVRVMEPGQTESRTLTAGESIPEGSFVLTQQGGSATLSPVEGVATQITESSSVRILDVEVTPGITPKIEYDIKEGSILSAIGREDGEPIDYKIRTPQGVVAARGTVIGINVGGGVTAVFGAHGLIGFSYDGNATDIQPGSFKQFTGPAGSVQPGNDVAQGSPQFQQMINRTVRLVDRAAGFGLVRPGLPNDVRGALQQAGIPTPPPAPVSPPPATGNDNTPGGEGTPNQPSPQPTAGNRRGTGRGLPVQGGSQSGFSKMIVVEGTMRVYLNDRLGESMLIKPGEMIILNPNANRLPRPVKVNLGRLVRSSGLISGMDPDNEPNDPNTGGPTNDPVLTDNNVREALNEQQKQIESGELATTDVAVVKNRLLPKSTVLKEKESGRNIIDRRTSVTSSQTGISQYFVKPPIHPGTTTIRGTSKIVAAPPVVTTANGTATGSIYPAGSRKSIADFAFEDGQKPIDSAMSIGDGGPAEPLDKTAALFKFENLRIAGNPEITRTTLSGVSESLLPEVVGFISINELLFGNGLSVVGPNYGLGLPEEVFIVSENAGVQIDDATLSGLTNEWVFYGRGGDVTINNSNFSLPTGSLSFAAQNDILTTGTNNFDVDRIDFNALVDVDLSNSNSFFTNELQVRGRNITLPATVESNSGNLTIRYDDINGSASPFALDASQFPLGPLDSFRGLFSGTDVEINNNFDIVGPSQARLDLGTSEFFFINGVSVSAEGPDFASVDVIGEQGITMLTGSSVDAISSDGSAATMIGSNFGPIQISNNASVLADGYSDAMLFVNAGTNSFDLGTTAGAGGSLSAVSSFGEAEVGVNSQMGLGVNGTSSIDASGESKSTVSLRDSGISGVVVDGGASITSSSISDQAFTRIESVLGDISTGNSATLSADGSLNSVVDLAARTGIQIGNLSSVQAGFTTPGDAASVNITNSGSGDVTFGDGSQVLAQTNATGQGNIAVTSSGGEITLGIGTGGSSFTASGGNEHHIDLEARTGITVRQGSTVESTVTGDGQATASFVNTGPGNVFVESDTTIRAVSDQNSTGQHTTVRFKNDNGQILIGQTGGTPTVIQAEVTNNATGPNTVPSIFFEATNGVEIRNTSDIHAILGAAVNGQGKIFVSNNGSGDILIGDGATLTADSGVNAASDPLQEGEILIENQTGNVEIGNGIGGATLTAERITARALGGGNLKIYGGSVLTANKQATLFAESATNGIQFVNNGNPTISISSPQTLVRAPVISVDTGLTVNIGTGNTGDILDIQANTKNWSTGGPIGSQGDISFNAATVPNANGSGTGNFGTGNYNVSNF